VILITLKNKTIYVWYKPSKIMKYPFKNY